ncbi:MAG: alpha/beta hydrolase [Cellulomonadaceae bacterium]
MTSTNRWHEDVLGPQWRARTIRLGADSEGPVDATLVRHRLLGRRPRAVLYLHGYVDYFFQTDMAQTFIDHGYDFYALDRRKHGRSLHPEQTPNYTTDLSDYAAEIDEAVRIVRAEAPRTGVVLLGHSTGGLIGSLWANARPGRVDALVLNSPWFDLNRDWFTRTVGTRAIDALGRVAPRTVVGHLGQHYGRALHRGTGGEWDYDLAWKPHEGFPVRAGWMRTVRRAHARVARGLDVRCPVLVCTSDATGDASRWHDGLLTTDSVLDVDQIAARASGLGRDVTQVRVPSGSHDLALSPEPARTTYLETALGWLEDALP